MGKRKHSFLYILLKPQIFIPLKFGGIGGNKIRFMAHLVDCNRHCNITGIPMV